MAEAVDVLLLVEEGEVDLGVGEREPQQKPVRARTPYEKIDSREKRGGRKEMYVNGKRFCSVCRCLEILRSRNQSMFEDLSDRIISRYVEFFVNFESMFEDLSDRIISSK